MGQKDREAAELIESIANKKQGGLRFPVMSGTVVAGSVKNDELVCKVQLSIDDDDSTATEGVLLNAVSLNSNGMILYPADGSNVLVAEVDGPGSKLAIIRCSDLVKMQVTIGGTTFTIINGKVKAEDGAGAVLEMSGGMFKLSNATGSLGSMIDGLMDDLIGAAMTTGGGPGTFDPTTIGKLTADKTKLAAILK